MKGLEAVVRMCSVKKVFLEKKETLAQVFSCEFCEIFKNTFSHRTPLVAASEGFVISNKSGEIMKLSSP